MIKAKKKSALITLALIFLCNPNINMFDVLPDFIAFFILLSVVSPVSYVLPYFEEARTAIKRLAIVTLLRIPAALIVFSNMHTGRDIVPLFTLIFAVLEGILLFSAITNTADGLFYLGQRSDADSLLSGSRVFGRSITSDGLKLFTLLFFLAKCTLNVLPELCLLTTYNTKLRYVLNIAYPILLILTILTVLTLGLAWLSASRKYLKRTVTTSDIGACIAELAGEDGMKRIETKLKLSRMLASLTLMLVGSLFTFDLAFDNTNGINILPRFICILIYLFAAFKMLSDRKTKTVLSVIALIYTVISLVNHYFTILFYDNHELLDLLDRATAKEAYAPIKIFSSLELLVLIPFIILMAVGFTKFIHKHTGISRDSEAYNQIERTFHRKMATKGYVIFSLIFLINLGKCTSVFLSEHITLLPGSNGIVVAPLLPWFNFALIALSIALIIYSFYSLSSVKSEIKFKYDSEENDARRGVFE